MFLAGNKVKRKGKLIFGIYYIYRYIVYPWLTIYGHVGFKVPLHLPRKTVLAPFMYHPLPKYSLPTNGPVWPPIPSELKNDPMIRLILIPHGISVLTFWIPSAPGVAVHEVIFEGQKYKAWSDGLGRKPPPQWALELKGTVHGPLALFKVPGYADVQWLERARSSDQAARKYVHLWLETGWLVWLKPSRFRKWRMISMFQFSISATVGSLLFWNGLTW